MPIQTHAARVVDSRHPYYISGVADWEKWRRCYQGGDAFMHAYLERFSTRETSEDFTRRRNMTPIPTFAKAAINDIRNSIFQRMHDIIRKGGTKSYQEAIAGLNGGVDQRGSTMNAFLGQKVLTELLVMGRVGIYVDMPVVYQNDTLLDVQGKRPYLYCYQVEDIFSWAESAADRPSEFKSVLLRDTAMRYDATTFLPINEFKRFRLLTINDRGRVEIQFYDEKGDVIDPQTGLPIIDEGPIELALTRIPFVMLDLGGSLLDDVASYQIALLNLISSDVNYALLANFPFYIEQANKKNGHHLKPAANADGTATAGGQGAADMDVKVGTTQGRLYVGDQAPGFIHPSPEPLRASMELRSQLEEEVRKLVNLAVINIASRASAESKTMDNQGLESGLSFIGLVLENGERQIADHWTAYETANSSQKQQITIQYPTRYKLKTDEERITEASTLAELMFKVPGRTIKKEIAKNIVTVLLQGKISLETMEAIHKEIDDAEFTTSDPDTIIKAHGEGIIGDQIAAIALGFSNEEHLNARNDHLARIIRIAEAQRPKDEGNDEGNDLKNPAARGVDDLDPDKGSGEDEKAASRDTTLDPDSKSRVRGEGRFTKKG